MYREFGGHVMAKYQFSKTVVALWSTLCFFIPVFSASQYIPVTHVAENTSDSAPAAPLQIKLSVNEVRLDVVVLDKKGNQITDLSADDFEVYQDGKQQKILACVYIDSQSDTTGRPASALKYTPDLQLASKTMPKEEDVRRTILFVIDDYAMNFENGYYTKMALRNFVEKQMQQGDIVAIFRTNYGNRDLNMFQSEKREVLVRINAMPPAMASRDFGSANPTATKLMENNFRTNDIENQISAIANSLRAMENMPGRKILIMLNPLHLPSSNADGVLDLYEPDFRYWRANEVNSVRKLAEDDIRKQTDNAMLKLADDAMRAGVVVNLLDIDGVYNPYIDASKSITEGLAFGARYSPEILIQTAQKRLATVLPDPLYEQNPLPAQTGGISIRNSNFFLDGIGKEVESLMKGYYLISYEPPPNTFGAHGRKDEFHRLKVNVKRKDAEVHTRSGFFGRLEESESEPPKNPLLAAIHSPFQSTDLNVNIASGYVKDAEAGYVVRSWIHIDPKDVRVTETEDGGGRIEIETLCVTSDINGNIQDSKAAKFALGISAESKSESLAWIQKHGIRFSMLLPVKKPGPYYIQISVQDAGTGKVGSAYQFLEIPEVGRKGLALSDIFMITSAEDLKWISSDVRKEVSSGGVFLPVFQGDVRSPALRRYASGDELYTIGMLYNADESSLARSEIEMRAVLFRDGAEFRSGETVPVKAESGRIRDGIPVLQRLTIGPDMPPGDYVLQLLVSDKKNNRKQEENATQAVSFTVVEK